MTHHTITAPISVEGRNGSLDGWEATCSCGLRMTNSGRIGLTNDMAEHHRWHVRRDADQSRSGSAFYGTRKP